MSQWYIENNQQQVGPFDTSQVQQMVSTGKISPQTLVWTQGMESWAPAYTVDGLVIVAPPIIPTARPAFPPVLPAKTSRGKIKNTAGILAILLGGFGVHKFYLGAWGWGIIYVVFCWTYIPAIAGLVEGIIMLTKSDTDFDEHYNLRPVSPFTW